MSGPRERINPIWDDLEDAETGTAAQRGIARVGVIAEWHVDLRKPKGGSDMGKAGLAWEDGSWQPPHPAKEAHDAPL
jgi:hypothetical protein